MSSALERLWEGTEASMSRLGYTGGLKVLPVSLNMHYKCAGRDRTRPLRISNVLNLFIDLS